MDNKEELLKLLNKLVEKIDESGITKFTEEDKKRLKVDVMDRVDEAEDVCVCITEKGIITAGAGINMLGAMSAFAHQLKRRYNMDDEMIMSAVKTGLKSEDIIEED